MLGQEAASLSRHMGHSLKTNYEFYQAYVVPKDSIASFVKILGKWKPGEQVDESNTPPPKHRGWTDEHQQAIHTYFATLTKK